jgi:hypothetical protein
MYFSVSSSDGIFPIIMMETCSSDHRVSWFLFLLHVIFPFLSNKRKLWENFHVYYLSSLLLGLEVSTPHGPELHLHVAAPGHAYTTEACAAAGLPSKTEACTWTCLDFRGLWCTWACLYHRDPSCTWTCLDKRSLCWPWTCLQHRGPELHPEVSRKQEPVLGWT